MKIRPEFYTMTIFWSFAVGSVFTSIYWTVIIADSYDLNVVKTLIISVGSPIVLVLAIPRLLYGLNWLFKKLRLMK